MPGNDLIQSLTRGLRVLEAVSSSDDGLSVAQLARILEVAPPTAHNIIRTLAERGYLERRESPVRYSLGRAALELAHRNQRDRLRRNAASALLEIANRHPTATLTLTLASGEEVMMALRVSPDRPGLLQHPVSQSLRPYTSASSLLFQAYWSPVQRAAYRARYPFAEYAPSDWKSEKQLDAWLEAAQQQGWVVLSDAALCRIAAPVLDDDGQVIGALGLSLPGPVSAATADKLARTIAAAARQINSPHDPQGRK